MKKIAENIGLTLLSIVFTIGLTYASIEGPNILLGFIKNNDGVFFGIQKQLQSIIPLFITTGSMEFISGYVVKPIGYLSVIIILLMIGVGFYIEKYKISSLGAVAFFLPTFAYFAEDMFFLAGLGFLRLIWLPIWGPFIRIADIVYLPSIIFLSIATLCEIHMGMFLIVSLIFSGLLIFQLGTLAWFIAKFRGKAMVDSWVYKFSRHPQYLGWIVWSYGFMLLMTQMTGAKGSENWGASLPWLISTLTIICVARGEEIRMLKQSGRSYAEYQERVPFMLPLPRTITTFITLPIRLILKKEKPETKWDLLSVFLIYLSIAILISLPMYLSNYWPDYTLAAWFRAHM